MGRESSGFCFIASSKHPHKFMRLPKSIGWLAAILVFCGSAFGTTRYVAQTAGSITCHGGTQTAIAPATWNSTSESAGDITYVCGTITGTAGGTVLAVPSSGASGNPIQIIFDTGAKLTATYWSTNGAINGNGQTYITLNGGTNGLITATANGTSLANQQASTGITIGSHWILENLSVTNTYVISGSTDESAGANGSTGISIPTGADGFTITGCTVSQAENGIFAAYSTITSATISNNTVDYARWMIGLGDDNGGSSASGVNVYGNTFGIPLLRVG